MHTQTEGAEAAREAVRTRHEAARAELVTRHGHLGAPPEVVPANAERLRKRATASGYEVTVTFGWWKIYAGQARERVVPSVQVAGKRQSSRTGFRAVWADGKAVLGLWYDGRSGSPLPADVGVSAVAERV
jgi:hypothetical protein